MNPDAYHFLDFCWTCGEGRSVSASHNEIRSGKPVTVYAIACDHSWTLNPVKGQKLRERTADAAA
jgi:hypothetical protein